MLSWHRATIWPIRSAVAGALACLADPRGAADAGQHGLHGLTAGWWLMAGHLVVVADGGSTAADGAGLAPAVGETGQIGGDDANVRWQGCGAPGDKVPPVARIRRAGRQRLLRLGVDRSRRWSGRRAEGDQAIPWCCTSYAELIRGARRHRMLAGVRQTRAGR